MGVRKLFVRGDEQLPRVVALLVPRFDPGRMLGRRRVQTVRRSCGESS